MEKAQSYKGKTNSPSSFLGIFSGGSSGSRGGCGAPFLARSPEWFDAVGQCHLDFFFGQSERFQMTAIVTVVVVAVVVVVVVVVVRIMLLLTAVVIVVVVAGTGTMARVGVTAVGLGVGAQHWYRRCGFGQQNVH
ncbi:hypothetical protein T07_3714 [Trichinella nelsoni]|uniref:Transmembrane protein n=1 Tax=Trichinella nelsoni TaxID=6336 RepID=A0A0V0SE78_9BILA|nr:hypothetical protein T07_3714 [Trichinella nelsoni]